MKDSLLAQESRSLLLVSSRTRQQGVESTSCVAPLGHDPEVQWGDCMPLYLGGELCSHGGLKLSIKIPTCSYLALGGELTQVPRAEIFHVQFQPRGKFC